jgi:nitrogen regulatory protein PII
MMKMVMVVYNEAMDLEVMEVLQGCAMKNFTKVMGVYGRGTHSGTHMGNDIWPGRNNILYVACAPEQARKLLGCVAALKKTLGHEGIKAFLMPVEESV